MAGRLLMLASRASLTAARNLVGTRPPHRTVDAPFKMPRSTRKASHAARGARGLSRRCGPSASRALDAFRFSAVAVLARHAVDAACLLGQRLVLARLAASAARAARCGCKGARRTLDARTLRCRVLVLASRAAFACFLSFREVCVLPRRAVATDPLGRACLARGASDAGVHGAQYGGPVAKRRASAGAERALASCCRNVVVLADLAVLAAGGGALPAAAGLLRPSAAFYARARPVRRGRHVCAKGAVRAGCIGASLSREPELRRRASENARTRADEMDGHSLPPFTDVARLLAGCLLVFAGWAGRTARRLLSGTRLTRGAVGAFLLPGRKPPRSARCARCFSWGCRPAAGSAVSTLAHAGDSAVRVGVSAPVALVWARLAAGGGGVDARGRGHARDNRGIAAREPCGAHASGSIPAVASRPVRICPGQVVGAHQLDRSVFSRRAELAGGAGPGRRRESARQRL